jgi:hypothetical protein
VPRGMNDDNVWFTWRTVRLTALVLVILGGLIYVAFARYLVAQEAQCHESCVARGYKHSNYTAPHAPGVRGIGLPEKCSCN